MNIKVMQYKEYNELIKGKYGHSVLEFHALSKHTRRLTFLDEVYSICSELENTFLTNKITESIIRNTLLLEYTLYLTNFFKYDIELFDKLYLYLKNNKHNHIDIYELKRELKI